MIRDWFDAKEAVEFARDISRDINRLFPPTPRAGKASSAKKDKKKLDGLVIRTRKFAQQHKLNVYKKARLLNTIKWELKDAGQGTAVIDEIIALLTPVVS